MTWLDDAACAGMDTDIFFPEREDRAAYQQARQVCRRCPVAQKCLDYAISFETRDNNTGAGIYAATTAYQRHQAIRRTA